jgi:hypothetical protein
MTSIEETTMRTVTLALVACLLLSAGCTGSVVIRKPAGPPPPVVKRLGIPPGHLPAPGQCRIWYPGKPPGHQPPPGRCGVLRHEVPAGAWLLYRPEHRKKEIHVSVIHARRPGVVVAIRHYLVSTGKFLREE